MSKINKKIENKNGKMELLLFLWRPVMHRSGYLVAEKRMLWMSQYSRSDLRVRIFRCSHRERLHPLAQRSWKVWLRGRPQFDRTFWWALQSRRIEKGLTLGCRLPKRYLTSQDKWGNPTQPSSLTNPQISGPAVKKMNGEKFLIKKRDDIK